MSSTELRLVDPVGYCQMVAIAWFLYDYLLTLADEKEYVWSRRVTPMIGLFLVTRYVAFALLGASVAVYFIRGLDQKSCDIFDWISAAGTFLLVILVDIILQFRIYVMYGGSRKILYINGALFLVAIAGAITFASLFFPVAIDAPPNAEGSCYAWRSPKLSAIWVTPLLFDIYLATLAVLRYNKEWRRQSGRNVNLLRILTIDNVAYFVLMTTATAVVFCMWLFIKVTPGAASVSLVHTAGAVGGSRLIINVRKAMEENDQAQLPTPLDAPSVHSQAMYHLRELRPARPPQSSANTRRTSSESIDNVEAVHKP
ncbi:hypothetical protein EXIGLDRAFT_722549 [Exidia glandulosa HHB12029]|uniref:DUF6533 domain-containing protein n=1 Tax=Exidia glandulosa HHB12029 TaxID=1314781 RepID=A0A165F8P2_EXIGL|nr:hypothetical protein EXIGLDRAFT_722549 [Exidia glandulosa HHB12029]